MRQTTLWIILKDDKILLCMKKRWFWEWLWNWAWWKCEKWETIEQAMIRELQEETWLETNLENLENMWVLHFYFDANPDWNQDVNIFKINDFDWAPTETEEMRPKWFNLEDIPYNEMWEDDKIWLPRMISLEKVEYDFTFWNDWKIKEFKQII